MNWLEHPQDEAERLVRAGLDLAVQRTGDEITHRRVWSKVADTLVMPERRVSGRVVLLAASAAVAVLAVGGVVLYPYLDGRAPQVAAPAPQQKATPEPTAPTDQRAMTEAERAPGKVVRTHKGERVRVALGGGAVADLDQESAITWDAQHRPSVQRGTASLSVPHQPPGWRFSVTAGPYVVTVVGTKFKIDVGGQTVGVEVTEGIVEVSRGSETTRLVAGDAWNGPLVPEDSDKQAAPVRAPSHATGPSERPRSTASSSGSLAPAKPIAPANRRLRDAQSALQSGDVSRALEILNQTAEGTGPSAENAAYELARITRYNLGKPRQAVALWEKYRTRFPSGILRTETDLSIVDTLSQLGEVQSALTEAKSFLAKHPNSERRQEVQRLIERLHATEASSDVR